MREELDNPVGDSGRVTTAPCLSGLDLSTLHNKGSLRAEYSINKDTGLVSVPVSNIAQFQREDATIQKVMGKKK